MTTYAVTIDGRSFMRGESTSRRVNNRMVAEDAYNQLCAVSSYSQAARKTMVVTVVQGDGSGTVVTAYRTTVNGIRAYPRGIPQTAEEGTYA